MPIGDSMHAQFRVFASAAAACLLATSLVLFASSASAQQGRNPAADARSAAYMFYLAETAYARGEYPLARQWLRQSASLGNAEAMFQLARLYETGLSGLSNADEAWALYSAAAQQGHAGAQAEVAALERLVAVTSAAAMSDEAVPARAASRHPAAVLIEARAEEFSLSQIEPVPPAPAPTKVAESPADPPEATVEQAVLPAEALAPDQVAEVAPAEVLVAATSRPAETVQRARRATYMLRLGETEYARKDYPLARQWLRQAASLGDAEAMFLLGRMYETGQAGVQDADEAWYLYSQAAQRGHPRAQAEVEMLRDLAAPL